MPISIGPGGRGGGGGAGGSRLTLVHSPAITPAAERLANVPGQIRGTVILDISDLAVFQAITAGTLTIGSETLSGLDLSAVTTINEVIVGLQAAIDANATLMGSYTISLDYINPNFYGRILRSDGDVEAVSGTIEPLFDFTPPGNTVLHVGRSPFIVLPEPAGGGEWSHLAFRALGQSYRTQYWHFRSDFWAGTPENTAQYLAFNNSGGWQTATYAESGEIQVGVVVAYNVDYFNVFYDPATRMVSWQPARTQPTSTNWVPSIETLQVMGQ